MALELFGGCEGGMAICQLRLMAILTGGYSRPKWVVGLRWSSNSGGSHRWILGVDKVAQATDTWLSR
uniref:Uncharacterized protein n=1 Tax=Oryza glumipatula TaxID=40148 RepID=A0A0D9ZGT9_9ORYZ